MIPCAVFTRKKICSACLYTCVKFDVASSELNLFQGSTTEKLMMGKFLLSGALLLVLCGFTIAQIPDDYDMPPAQLEVKRPRAYEYGDYGVVMDDRQSTVLKCTAEGRPAPTYSWEKDGKPVNTSDPRITVEDGVLTIDVPTTEDEGQYQCFATNPYGTALSPKYRTVYAFQKPYVDVTPLEFEFNVGEEVLLDCGAPDGAPEPTIYWVDKEQERLTLSDRIAFTEEGGLYFSNVEKADDGPYYCFTGNNLLGTFMRSPARYLDINAGTASLRAAAISHLSTETEGLQGQSKAIRCLATGYPTPEISWFRNGQQIPEASLENFNQDLYFESLDFENGGSYECRATNAQNSQPDTRSVLLTVESAPYFSIPTRDVVIPPGGTDEIVCGAGGVPEPELTWLQNGQPIRMAEGSPYQVDGDTIRIIEPLEGQSTVFQCILENVHGERVGSYTITVLDGEEKNCKYTDWVDVLAADMIHIDELVAETEYVVFMEQSNKEGLTPGSGPVGIFATVGKGAATTIGAVICVIILLLIYNVSDKENQLKDESAPLKNNDGFAEFNNSDFPDDIEGSQDSLASNPDDDGVSLKEYADDEDPSKFNEEGSFIEEYHDPNPRSTDQREGGTSTFV